MRVNVEQVIIANGANVSNVIDLRSETLLAIITPAAWTAADIAFVGSATTDGTFVPVVDWDGLPWACTAIAAQCITPRQEVGEALPFVKLHSVSTADNTANVNQGAERILTLITCPRVT